MKIAFTASIGKKIIGGFLILTAIIVALSFLTFHNLRIIETMVYNRLMEKANARSLVKDIIIRGNQLFNLINQYCLERDPDEKNAIRTNINDEIQVINVFIQQIFSHDLTREEKDVLARLNTSFRALSGKTRSVLETSVMDSEFTALNLKFTTQMHQVDRIETELMYQAWQGARDRINFIKASILFFCCLSFVIGFAINIINIKAVVNPILNLAKVLDEYGRGNSAVRADAGSRDEIGFFARKFNLMLEQINESAEGIRKSNDEIQQRNDELASINRELEMTHNELIQANERLFEEKEKMATTLDSLGEGVIAADINGRVEFMNKSAEQIIMCLPEDYKGKTLQEVFLIRHSDTNEPYGNPVEATMETGGKIDYGGKAVLVTSTGESRIISPIIAPIRDKHGGMIGIVIIFRDITDRLMMEEELQKASRVESLGIIAGGIAHDFNNLLTSIIGNISLARASLNSEDGNYDILKEAEMVSLRTKDLTQQLLTFSKGGEPIIKTVLIGSLLVETSTFVLRGSKVRAVTNIPPDLWSARADEGQISQVLHNLILNAREAMPTGGEMKISAVNVMITQSDRLPLEEGPYVRISIADSGCGIPKENLNKIFDPYFTTKDKGHGLGLAVAYSIIRKHGGHICIDSTSGKGSTFVIYLSASPQVQKETAFHANAQAFDGKRLLLMDDEEMILSVGKRIFEHLGMDVLCARDGSETIHYYEEALHSGKKFDLVIMDLTIPGGLGGKDTILKLREIDPGIRAFVSSGYSNDPVMANYREFGFCGVIEKPYRIDDVRFALGNFLAQE